MSSWFVKKRQQKTAVEAKTVRVPEGLWIKCDACKELIYRKELVNTHNVCPRVWLSLPHRCVPGRYRPGHGCPGEPDATATLDDSTHRPRLTLHDSG